MVISKGTSLIQDYELPLYADSFLASAEVHSSLGLTRVKNNINTLTRVVSSNSAQCPYKLGENVAYMCVEMQF